MVSPPTSQAAFSSVRLPPSTRLIPIKTGTIGTAKARARATKGRAASTLAAPTTSTMAAMIHGRYERSESSLMA
jgi:hypothetical protein